MTCVWFSTHLLHHHQKIHFSLVRTSFIRVISKGISNTQKTVFPGGSLAVRGCSKAMRNNDIGCAMLLAVIEGVGIAFGRMMAENTRLEAPPTPQQQTPSLAA